MGKFAKELIESLQQSARHAAGRKVRGLRVSKVELPDVKAIRLPLRMSEHHFAAEFRTASHAEELGARTAHAGCSHGRLSSGDQAASKGNHGSSRAAVSGTGVSVNLGPGRFDLPRIKRSAADRSTPFTVSAVSLPSRTSASTSPTGPTKSIRPER